MIKKLLMLVLFLAPLTISAQKFAHFDLEATASQLPAYKQAMTELQTLGQQYQKNLDDMQKELQAKYDKYSKEVNEKTPQNIKDRYAQELQQMSDKLEQARQDNAKAVQEAQQQKMQPITQKVLDAVQAVAKEGNYVYIMDVATARANSVFINTAVSEDVTAKVKAKLGI